MDITFGTDGWRVPREQVTPDRLHAIATAVCEVLADRGYADTPVAVGYDARKAAREHAQELARVLAAYGHDVLFTARDCPTPALANAIVERDLAGGLMVTASHNPPAYSGVKFIPEDGAPALPAITDEIEAALGEPDPPETPTGEVTEVDVIEPHIDAVLDRLAVDLDGLTVAYDGMYGSGRGVTDQALERAGAEVIRHRCDRDPTFGGGDPNPTPDRLQDLQATVTSGEATLGIANDGDADRVAVVTPDGYVNANALFGVFYEYLLDAETGPAVRTVSTTFLIDRIAQAHGEDTVETPVGFKWVAEAMAEHNALIGGEESGGFTIRDHIRLKDGILAGVLAAAAASETPIEDRIDHLMATHGEIHQDRVSMDCPNEQKDPVMESLSTNQPETIAGETVSNVNTADGLKLLLADGSWLLIRPSGTEPKLRIYAEATTDVRVEELLTAGREFVANHRDTE